MSGYHYPGNELESFGKAVNWRRYLGKILRPWLRGRVLEVGAGIGMTSAVLLNDRVNTWTCLEPDQSQLERLRANLADHPLGSRVRPLCGTISDISPEDQFEAILYIDVLEHIENDHEEATRAATRLSPGGRLIILCPAHEFLFSEWDSSLGHFRRYNRQTLKEAIPTNLHAEYCRHLDSCGFIASIGNRWILHQGTISERQVRFWDRALVPVSRLTDPLLGRWFGRSILGVWTRPS